MATNKHATIRYHALDKCFSNYGRKYYIENLISACNEAIYEFAGINDGVKRRQIFDDITFMESEQGWSISLERVKDGRRVYYRYSDKSFSIKNRGINQSEAEQLKETMSILSRFKGMPQFEWIEEMKVRLEDSFKLKDNIHSFVGFEQNPYLKGLNHFSGIFNSIQNRIALKIKYQGYKQIKPSELTIHPWYLKQFNNRWFLFCFNEKYNSITNFALDRIVDFEESNIDYRNNTDIDFEEYFEDVVGVTIKSDSPTEKIIIKVNKDVWPYIESKPLHGSQKIISKSDIEVIIEIFVQVNHELMALLFSFMDSVEVVEPKTVRRQFKKITETLHEKYF